MSRPSTKQKPPPYPRPVEYVCADEIAPQLEDLAYRSRSDKRNGTLQPVESDTEHEAGRRAQKRRRIESYATAYLRGEPLYIMSAQLKGPFDKSWKNPWAKTRVGQISIGDLPKPEVPETVQKKIDSVQKTKDKREAVLKAKKRYLVLKSESWEGTPIQRSSNGFVPPTSPITESAGKSPKIRPKVGDIGATRVKDWLRTNGELMDDSGVLSASPTPTMSRTTSKQPFIQHPNLADQGPSSVQTNRENSDTGSFNPHAARPEGSLSTDVAQRVQQLSHQVHHAIGHRAVSSKVSAGADTEQVSVESVEDVTKAGSTVSKPTHVALHVAPSEANFSPFEYKRATIKNEVTAKRGHSQQWHSHDPHGLNDVSTSGVGSPRAIRKDQDIIIRAPDRLSPEEVSLVSGGHRGATLKQLAPENSSKVYDQHVTGKEPATGNEQIIRQDRQVKQMNIGHVLAEPQDESSNIVYQQSRPIQSTATSDINTVDLLPSAQRPPELVPGLSSEVCEHSLLENTTGQTDWVDDQTTDHTPTELVSDHDITPRTSISGAQQQKPGLGSLSHISVSVPVPAADIPLVPSSPAVPPSTQEMLAGITPFTFSTIKKRTTTTLQETPVTATKKKRKTASFAPDLHSSTSSHGSIQSTMRGKISKKLTSPPPLLVKDSMCMDTTDDDTSRFKPSQSLPRGILKPTSSSNSIRQSKISLFSGCEQDHHTATSDIPMGSGQNNGLVEEAFDLDAAISEIGSFLSPWAVDKEIEGMIS